MSGKITITNQSPNEVAVIDIEGVIGVPEQWQFDDPGERVATYEKFRSVVDAIKEVNAPEIVVNIRSTGGNVNDALLILDTLSSLGGRITTRCFGYVASAATIIAQAASPGCRELSSNSLYLVHRSVCIAEGNAQEILRSLDMLDKTDQRIASVYALRSGKSAEQFSDLMAENSGNGRWLSPEEAVGYSLADKVVGSAPISADAADMVKNFGLPPIPDTKRGRVMNLSRRWDAMLKKLGLVAVKDAEQDDAAVGEDNAGDALPVADVSEEIVRAHTEIYERHSKEVAGLQDRISMLEAHNAQLSAMPTQTRAKEDPAIYDTKHSPNQDAYHDDLRGFRG